MQVDTFYPDVKLADPHVQQIYARKVTVQLLISSAFVDSTPLCIPFLIAFSGF
jgi:hypothetical protein